MTQMELQKQVVYEYIVIIYEKIKASIERQQELLAEIAAGLLRDADDWLNIDYYGKTIMYSSYEAHATNNDKYAKGRLIKITDDYDVLK